MRGPGHAEALERRRELLERRGRRGKRKGLLRGVPSAAARARHGRAQVRGAAAPPKLELQNSRKVINKYFLLWCKYKITLCSPVLGENE